MKQSFPIFHPILAAAAVFLPLAGIALADPTVVVLQNGRSVPVSAVSMRGDALVLTTDVPGFNKGQTIPLSSTDHIYGDKPAEVNSGIALLLSGNAADAIKVLEPIVASERVTAKIPGNFWLEPARAILVAYAMNRDKDESEKIGKEISDAAPGGGSDPFVMLGKALLLPPSATVAERETAFRDLTVPENHSPVCAYASFYLGNVLREAKRDEDALEAYLMVPCLFPAGGIILNAAAELNAADFLLTETRRDEAVALLKSAVRDAVGTSLAADARKRLDSAK